MQTVRISDAIIIAGTYAWLFAHGKTQNCFFFCIFHLNIISRNSPGYLPAAEQNHSQRLQAVRQSVGRKGKAQGVVHPKSPNCQFEF